MKKNLLKSSIVTWSLLAFGFLMLSWSNTANTVNAQESSWSGNAEVVLTITQWDLTIGITGDFSTGITLEWATVSNEVITRTGAFGEDSFWLSDQKWIESGYYTTLSVTNLSWDNDPTSHVITNDHVFLKSTELHTIEWVTGADAGVKIGLSGDNYVSMANPVTYFTRPTTATVNAWKLWKYGDNLQIKVEIPPHTLADTYRGTITYTLYDWAQPSE